MCNGVHREGAKLSSALASELFCYVPITQHLVQRPSFYHSQERFHDAIPIVVVRRFGAHEIAPQGRRLRAQAPPRTASQPGRETLKGKEHAGNTTTTNKFQKKQNNWNNSTK